jgi:hypothetical protein
MCLCSVWPCTRHRACRLDVSSGIRQYASGTSSSYGTNGRCWSRHEHVRRSPYGLLLLCSNRATSSITACPLAPSPDCSSRDWSDFDTGSRSSEESVEVDCKMPALVVRDSQPNAGEASHAPREEVWPSQSVERVIVVVEQAHVRRIAFQADKYLTTSHLIPEVMRHANQATVC